MALGYVESYKASHGNELLHSGVKGMKWGVRKDRSLGKANDPVLRAPKAGDKAALEEFAHHAQGKSAVHGKVVIDTAGVQALKDYGAGLMPKPTKENRDVPLTLSKQYWEKTAKFNEKLSKDIKPGSKIKLNNAAVRQLISTGMIEQAKRNGTQVKIDPYVRGPKGIERLATPKARKIMLAASVTALVARVVILGAVGVAVAGTPRVPSRTGGSFDSDNNGWMEADGFGETDYYAAALAKPLEVQHAGVKGMRWGVRKDRSSGSSRKPKPTKDRKREIENTAKAKEHAAITARIEKLKSGSGRPLVVKNKQLSKAESISVLEAKAKKIAPKEAKAPKKSDADGETVKLSDGTEITVGKKLAVDKDFETLKTQVREKGANSLTDDELKYVNARTEAVRKANEAYKKQDSWLAKTVKSTVKSALEQQLNKTAKKASDHFGDQLRAKMMERLKTKTKTATAKTASGNKLPVVYKVTSL